MERFDVVVIGAGHAGCEAALACARIAAIGPATARALRERGVAADVVPAHYRAEAVFEAMDAAARRAGETLEGSRVLIPRAQVAREELPRLLRGAGALVEVAPAYKTVSAAPAAAQDLAAQLAAGAVDGVTFTSSSTVQNLLAMLGEEAPALAKAKLFSIGPITTGSLERAGFEVAREAREYTVPGLVAALRAYYGEDGREGESR